ncbi:MAG: hypothetical protein APG10_01603 [Candidatus Methanofastidiosum methylothiophilum]|uniref:Uncharacterized protein n=1 Tax=Candidatus Methanofastidiosum methylothiophilum TaxID=1705564 RepID=A0A150IHZ8_9EURY|nr:MAG: hypothetical protein APG10_01603 [Candidatus Methanofastidiosum methylthiophilus]
MLDKINITNIIKDHLNTLKDFRVVKKNGGNFKSAPYYKEDLLLFFALPLLTSILLLYFDLLLNKELANVLITSLSIFAALLFNLLLLIYDVNKKNNIISGDKHTLIGQIYSNISFSIFIAIITIIILIIFFLSSGHIYNQCLEINSNNTTMINNTTMVNAASINTTCLNYSLIATYLFSFTSYYLVVLFILTLFMILKRINLLLWDEIK